MIKILLYSHDPEEVQCIRRMITSYSIQNNWADCQVEVITAPAKLQDADQPLDIIIADVSHPQAVECIKLFKSKYPPMLVFPIAGAETPPTVYVCPEIMPCGLFWRPVRQSTARPIIDQMMARIHDQTIPPSQSSFRIAGKQKIRDVPFSAILFFEAREKKIGLRMRDQELAFSGTLSQLEEELPADFIRCHKSFLVNRRHIMSVDRSNSIIVLDNQMELPISRSYKKAFWEVYRDDA